MTKSKKINKSGKKQRILVVPLDWGLGHATRCIPLINQILLSGSEVVIAAEGATELLLKNEFPGLVFLNLAGYRVKYSRKKIFLSLKLAGQIPKIIFSIYNEHQWLKKIIKKYKINAVISDNRLGLFSKKIQCVYITHQLLIKTGNIFTQKIAQYIHYWFIKNFNECWIPDFKNISLAGELSHPSKLPDKIKYIGALSRLHNTKDIIKEYDLIIIISGPEPQRSILEKILLSELTNFNGKFLFVRGLPAHEDQYDLQYPNGKFFNHLAGKELGEAMQKSKLTITRSGYTTIMDLIKLQQKAVLIPTPGQTEQEYLADYLMKQKIFYAVEQNNFRLNEVLEKVSEFQFLTPMYNMEEYKATVDSFINSM